MLMESFFKRPIQFMNFLGVNPYKKRTMALFLLAGFNAFAILVGAVTESTFSLIHFKKNDIIKALDGFGPALVKTVTTLKILYLWNQSETFQNTIRECKELLAQDQIITVDMEKFKIKSHYFKLAERLTLLTFFLAMFTNISFCLRPCVIMLSNHLSGREVDKLMPFNA